MAEEKSFKERSEINLNSLGGGIAGSGLGYLATLPMDRMHQKKLIKGSETMYQDQQISKKHWDTMYQIAKGNLSMEQLTPQQQQF